MSLQLIEAIPNLARVESLINSGANVNERNPDSLTALMVAASCPSVDSNGIRGWTWEKYKSCQQIIDLLLRAGADPNLSDDRGNTALHYAVYHRNIDAVRTLMSSRHLIENKTNPELRNSKGQTPLQLASLRRYPDLCYLLGQYAVQCTISEKEFGYSEYRQSVPKN